MNLYQEITFTASRRSRVRYFLAFWLFVLSGIAFLDRTNISIAGLQISTEYSLGNQRLGWMSFVNMGGQIGGAIAASLTPWIAQRYGWTNSFAVAAALALIGSVCWLIVHPERSLSDS
jgi:dipeptide/tripeptide permease